MEGHNLRDAAELDSATNHISSIRPTTQITKRVWLHPHDADNQYRSAAMPPHEEENSTMTAEPTGLFQGPAPALSDRTVDDGRRRRTARAPFFGNVIPKKVRDDEATLYDGVVHHGEC